MAFMRLTTSRIFIPSRELRAEKYYAASQRRYAFNIFELPFQEFGLPNAIRNGDRIPFSSLDRLSRSFSWTQLFKTREIWGINAYLLRSDRHEFSFVPTGAYEEGLAN